MDVYGAAEGAGPRRIADVNGRVGQQHERSVLRVRPRREIHVRTAWRQRVNDMPSLSTDLTAPPIVRALIDARLDWLLAGRPEPNRARVSEADAKALRDWFDACWEGRQTKPHAFGMDIFEDPTVTGGPVVECVE